MMRKQLRRDRKGMTLGDLAPAAVAFVVVAVTIGIGVTVMDSIQTSQITGATGCTTTNQSACGADYNASGQGIDSLGELASYLPTIAVVIAAAVVIGAIAYFRSR